MKAAVISGKSRKDLQLLIAIAKRIGLKAEYIDGDELEDLLLAKAMDQGATGRFISTEKLLKSLK